MARHGVARHAQRLLAAFLVLLPAALAPAAPATADDRLVGLFVATFSGEGAVKALDADDMHINVTTYNSTLGEHQCHAALWVGAVPGVVTCRFSFNATYAPFNDKSCSGIATGTGVVTLDGPVERVYVYPSMRAIVDDGSVVAAAHEVIDPNTGQTRPGYAAFEFAAPCGWEATMTGRAGY